MRRFAIDVSAGALDMSGVTSTFQVIPWGREVVS